jgi:hypothetical protein
MDSRELRVLELMSKAGKGPHLLLGVLGRVVHGKDRWTEQQRAILRRLARKRLVKIDWTIMYGDRAGRYNLYELTKGGHRALQLERTKKQR